MEKAGPSTSTNRLFVPPFQKHLPGEVGEGLFPKAAPSLLSKLYFGGELEEPSYSGGQEKVFLSGPVLFARSGSFLLRLIPGPM